MTHWLKQLVGSKPSRRTEVPSYSGAVRRPRLRLEELDPRINPALPLVTSPASAITVKAATFAIGGTADANTLVKVYTQSSRPRTS